ncbi:hypothetical protein NW825_15955 [Brevibacillus laterosporus]|nr:hypothetical protein [Brevibacillus laterosporus]
MLTGFSAIPTNNLIFDNAISHSTHLLSGKSSLFPTTVYYIFLIKEKGSYAFFQKVIRSFLLRGMKQSEIEVTKLLFHETFV